MNQIEYFHGLAKPSTIFSHKSYDKVTAVSMWYSFSKFIPKYLAKLALLSESKEVFSRLISISNEEMGDGSVEYIHSDLFKDACSELNVEIDKDYNIKAIQNLDSIEIEVLTDSYILGLHLGLEIIANENIELMSTIVGDKVPNTLFFKIHKVNEDEHIEKCVSNYSLFCTTKCMKEEFMEGFKSGLVFWENFWKEAANE